jgi:uncharacterized protein (TIGR03067 family)
MGRTLLLIAAVGLVAAAEAPKGDYKKMEGNWVLESGTKGGKKLSKEVVKKSRLTIKGNRHTVHIGDDVIKGTHKLDSTKKPKTIDATDTEGPYKDKTTLGIYELKSGKFTVCFSEPGLPRPKDFKTGSFRHTWKRAKKAAE